MTVKTSFQVITSSGPSLIEVSSDSATFILGGNGTGKSALVHNIATQFRDRSVYIPGSRPSYFDQESLSITPASRQQLVRNLLSWDQNVTTRWRPISGTSRNEKAIHDLTKSETQYKIDAANDIIEYGKDSSSIARLQSLESPLDRVNSLLLQANLPIQCIIDDGELKAKRGEQVYSIAKMSDGERSALILISEIVSAPANSVFIIDEPELHLHRAIVVPLLSTIIAERPDNIFIVSTHELDLPAEQENSKIIVVRECTWNGDNISSWSIDVISSTGDIPENLRIDVLGSRKKILFVEGDNSSSLDKPMYAILFPKVSVRHKDTRKEVERCVDGLRSIADTHHTEAYGLVDNDGMSEKYREKLKGKSVYSLRMHSIESLYYSQEVVAALAKRQSDTLGGDPKDMIKRAEEESLNSLKSDEPARTSLSSRLAERRFRDDLIESIPTRKDISSSVDTHVSIDVRSKFEYEKSRIEQLINEGSLFEIINLYPIRHSGILGKISTSLGFRSKHDYQKAALSLVEKDSALADELRRKFSELQGALE